MIKYKELLFLNKINRVGKVTIYTKYWDMLINSKDMDDLFNKLHKSNKISEDKLIKAKNEAEKIYDSVVNDSEINVITVFVKEYPKKLFDMENQKPLYLYVKGNIEALSKSNIAIIGTRKPSNNTEIFEKKIVKRILDVSKRVVVSGLALGCDKIAHETTVNENKITIAFLPCGLNVISPSSNKKLAKSIIEQDGCLVSEYEPDKKVFKRSYVERDKIVAAFSDIVFVLQCGEKSGTMHTVNATIDFKKVNHRDLYVYLPEDMSDGDYSGNISILKSNNGTKVSDIDEFCEEIVILEKDNNLNKNADYQSKLI